MQPAWEEGVGGRKTEKERTKMIFDNSRTCARNMKKSGCPESSGVIAIVIFRAVICSFSSSPMA